MRNLIWAILFIALILAVFIPSYSTMQDKAQKNKAFEEKIQELQVKQAELKEETRLLEEDPHYLEKVAREKMGLVKEGEVIVEITPQLTE